MPTIVSRVFKGKVLREKRSGGTRRASKGSRGFGGDSWVRKLTSAMRKAGK